MDPAMDLGLSYSVLLSSAGDVAYAIPHNNGVGMAGKELGFPIKQPLSLKEQKARNTLRIVRLRGHTYVDLREDGKSFVYFCTLCLCPCYSDTVLHDHLRGNFHQEKLEAAKLTLFGPNPWPFDDGILFFRNSDEGNVNQCVISGSSSSSSHSDVESRAIVVHSSAGSSGVIRGSGDVYSDYFGRSFDLVIPGVIAKDTICELGVTLMGYGQVSARLSEIGMAAIGVNSIWCEWLGKTVDDNLKCLESDFAIVTFRYYYDLGKEGLFEDIKSLLMLKEDNERLSGPGKKHKRSDSDPEDDGEFMSNQLDLVGEDYQASSTGNTTRLLLDQYDDDLLNGRIMTSKTIRRELRKQKQVAAERMCDICQHKMLPGKDVAALLNVKLGRFVCSSRNVHGAFHVFHTSCLIHWILFCEAEMLENKPVEPNSRQKSNTRTNSKRKESGKQCAEKKICGKRGSNKKQEVKVLRQQIRSVFCSDCQGTGLGGDGDELEKPTYYLSEIFRYKMKLNGGHKSWMKHPENLQNCSTGLHFPLPDEKAKEKVSVMKLLPFYRVDEDSWITTST